jgi:hypothetical protein
MKRVPFFTAALIIVLVGCSRSKDELRVTKTEITTLHNEVTGLVYGACLITAVGHDDAGKVEVKAVDSWGGCPQVGSTLLRCGWKGTGFAHEIAQSKENCIEPSKPAFYITEEREIQ